MNNLNSILVEGDLVKEPELSYTPKGMAMCRFTVASKRSFKQDDEMKEEVSYFDVSTWARLAEVCGEYLHKGRGVRVVGWLKQSTIVDLDSGIDHARVFIVAEHVEFRPTKAKVEAEHAEAIAL